MSQEDENGEREFTRRRALRLVQKHFMQNRQPRLMLSGILILTGGAGFLASFAMLKAGIFRMWLRYPLALLFAWAVFLVLVRLWAEFERKHFQLEEEEASTLMEISGPAPNIMGEALDQALNRNYSWWGEFFGCGDGEGCLFGLAILAGYFIIATTIGLVISILSAAPFLISEVFLDAILVTALYKRMRKLDRSSWLQNAVRHTMGPVLWVAFLLFLAGVVFHVTAPEAKSIRGVWHHWQHGPPPPELEKVD